MTAIQKAREELRGQLALLHSLANDTTEANWRDKRLYILQTCVRMSDALAALDAETPATPADVGEEPVAWVNERAIDDIAKGNEQDGFAGVQTVLWAGKNTAGKRHSKRAPLYSAAALERVVRERDEARKERDALAKKLDPGSDPALVSRIIMRSIENEMDARDAEAKLAEARKVIEPVDRFGMIDPASGHEPLYFGKVNDVENYAIAGEQYVRLSDYTALRARLETVEAETRERLSNELDPEIGLPSDARLRNIHADLEMRGRKHPDFAVTVHHRNIVLSAVAAELRNLEPRHD